MKLLNLLLLFLGVTSAFRFIPCLKIVQRLQTKSTSEANHDRPEIVQIKMDRINDKFIHLKTVPKSIKAISSLRSFLFVRRCYQELYENIKDILKDSLGRIRTGAILGTAGVGKSSLMLYYLFKWLDNPKEFFEFDTDRIAPTKRDFYIQSKADKVDYYRHLSNNKFQHSVITNEDDLDPLIPLFADMIHPVSPFRHDGLCLIFSSFCRPQYKELVKQQKGFYQYVPVWDGDELTEYVTSQQFQDDHSPFDSEYYRNRVLNGTYYFGGSVRNSIRWANYPVARPNEEIDFEIKNYGRAFVERFYIGLNLPDEHISDLLIHRTPIKDENGSYNYNQYEFILASQYVHEEMMKHHRLSMLAAAKTRFTGDSYRDSSAGVQFKNLLIYSRVLENKPLIAVPLQDTAAGLMPFTIKLPTATTLARNWKAATQYLATGVWYIPSWGNLESGDSFIVTTDAAGRNTLLLLQVTISDCHDIKQAGLVNIIDAFETNSNIEIYEVRVVFLVPKNAPLEKLQPLTTHSTMNSNKSKASGDADDEATVRVDPVYAEQKQVKRINKRVSTAAAHQFKVEIDFDKL